MMKQREEWETHRVERAKLQTDTGEFEERWLITHNKIPVYDINSYLDDLSISNPKTSKTYAFSLVVYLNYLELIGKTYKTATALTVKHYLTWRIYGYEKSLTIRSRGHQISYSTLVVDVSAIKGLYKSLFSEVSDLSMEVTIEKERVRNESFFYGQIYQRDYFKLLDKHIKNLKGSKEYIKWYTKDQLQAIIDNFKTLRDKSLFLLLLEGMRVDEGLSITLTSYNTFEKYVQPTRSKGKISVSGNEGNSLRRIYLDDLTVDCLDKYLLTERIDAETQSGKYSEYLFINLRKGGNQGEALSQANYRKILKRVSLKAGLNPDLIRTHSGRSTKVMQLLENEILYPKDGLTDLIIKELMGWKRIGSIESYKQNNNPTIAKAAYEKIRKRKHDEVNNK